ncbi:MAG: YlmC/YmxH family sporulation protein [Oscillospiraceae bacterium]|jgi:YlmC/YmxH family sporulation protein|nr:YlmC/YmxH family sporulation protein [Oscillospiraceae bacterium]
MQCCRVTDLRDKEVICIQDGTMLGSVCDVEVDTADGKLLSIIVFGRLRWFGILGREEDIIIPWREIKVIGEDTVLVTCEPPRGRRKRNFFAKLFSERK